MFEIKKINEKISYFESTTNVGIYNLDDRNVVLIDSADHIRLVKSLDKQLCEQDVTVKKIINTHCHVDHICGNKYFQDKYGCEIFATDLERNFIEYPSLEPAFYYSGIPTDKTLNPFFNTTVSKAKILNQSVLPENFEIIPLPGHSFDMIGVRIDDIVFLADSVLSRATMDRYKLPFFYNINESIETLEKVKKMKAKLFIPSHVEPLEDITELAEYNILKINEKKEMIFELCNGVGFEEIFSRLSTELDLKMTVAKYPLIAVVVRNYLQALLDDGRINAELDAYNIVYTKA